MTTTKKRKFSDVEKEVEDTANKLLNSYNPDIMQETLENDLKFLRGPKLNSEYTYIVSSLLSTEISKCSIEDISHLSQSNQGNTLGINLNNDYFIPIILDLDHNLCSKNHDCALEKNFIDNVITDIHGGLKEFLRNDKIKLYVEYRNCGIHIFVCNYIVSIFVYEQILKYLKQIRLDYFIDDNLLRLPLPGQTKDGKNPYTKKKSSEKWYMDKIKTFDYTYETTYQNHTNCIELCRFEHSTDIIQWNNLIESNICEERIITCGVIGPVKTHPNFLTRLTKRSIRTESRFFRDYCHTQREIFAKWSDINFRYDLKSHIQEIQILRALSRLGVLIGKQIGGKLYKERDDYGVETFENLKFIYQLFLPEPSELMFEIYATCAIVRYLKSSIIYMCYDEIFENFLLVLGSMISPDNTTMLMLTHLRNHIEHISLEVCGDLNSEYILQYITIFNYYKIRSNNNISEALTKIFTIEFDENCTDDVLETKFVNLIYPFLFPCVKTHSINDEYQFYHFNLKTFVKRTFTPGKKSDSPTSNGEMPLYYISHMFPKQRRNIVQKTFTQYISKIQTVTMKMGKYKYFINTDEGVFCNLTGTYLRHVPFLHFKDRAQVKKYGLYIRNGIDNKSCLDYVSTNARHLEKIIQNMKLFWFTDVFVPGLMGIELLKLSHMTFKKILSELKRRLFTEKPDAEKLALIYLPVKKKFKINYVNKLQFNCDEEIYREIYTHCRAILEWRLNLDDDKCVEIDNSVTLNDSPLEIKFPDPLLMETMQYIFRLFLYDETTTIEFLKQMSLLYQPKNQFRRFLLFFGATGTGKTVFVNLLSDFHGGSSCGIMSKLTINQASENAAPLALTAATSYLTIIKEASYVDRNILKNLSGNDPIQLRTLHQEFQTIEPVSFIICVANEYPKICGADNAIKDRIVCFNFPCSFVNELRCNNVLESHVHNEAIRCDLNPDLSIGLSNLLFLVFNHYTKNGNKLYPKITNSESARLLNEFMIHNNIVYDYLASAQITEDIDGNISEKEFKKVITRVIVERNNETSYLKFKKKFDVLFPNACRHDNIIVGFRLNTPQLFFSKLLVIERTGSENDTIVESDVISLLDSDDTLTTIERNSDLASFRRQYIFYKKENLYIGIALRNALV